MATTTIGLGQGVTTYEYREEILDYSSTTNGTGSWTHPVPGTGIYVNVTAIGGGAGAGGSEDSGTTTSSATSGSNGTPTIFSSIISPGGIGGGGGGHGAHSSVAAQGSKGLAGNINGVDGLRGKSSDSLSLPTKLNVLASFGDGGYPNRASGNSNSGGTGGTGGVVFDNLTVSGSLTYYIGKAGAGGVNGSNDAQNSIPTSGSNGALLLKYSIPHTN